MHCVDLGESFPTSIYLQTLASIHPRTSLKKFARSPRTDPPGLIVLFSVGSRGLLSEVFLSGSQRLVAQLAAQSDTEFFASSRSAAPLGAQVYRYATPEFLRSARHCSSSC